MVYFLFQGKIITMFGSGWSFSRYVTNQTHSKADIFPSVSYFLIVVSLQRGNRELC